MYSLIDYIIVLCCLLKKIDFGGTRTKQLVKTFKNENAKLKGSVSPKIYSMIIPNNVSVKITALETYLNS